MSVELIPVLEVGCGDAGIPAPNQSPFWEQPEAWNNYYAQCHAKAGFPDKLPPYLAGAPFYRLPDITAANLTKLLADHTQDLRKGTYAREQAVGFWGGYVLRVAGRDEFFPQCCGTLSDLVYWEQLAQGQPAVYDGHPAPVVKMFGEQLLFDFATGEFDEPFQPPPRATVAVSRAALQQAVEQAQRELAIFAGRLLALTAAAGLEIPQVTNLLIWNDGKHA